MGDRQNLGGRRSMHQRAELWQNKCHRNWRGKAKCVRAYSSLIASSLANWFISWLNWWWPPFTVQDYRERVAGSVGKLAQSKTFVLFLVSHTMILRTNGHQSPQYSHCWEILRASWHLNYQDCFSDRLPECLSSSYDFSETQVYFASILRAEKKRKYLTMCK